MDVNATLFFAWPLTGADGLRDELLAAYGDESRGYHDRVHLAEVCERLDELALGGASYDVEPVWLAAWFHDAVYDGQPGAEERSAAWAEAALAEVGVAAPVVAEVARLVRLTETHRPADQDLNGCALCDADLAVLASEPERYASYVAAVRAEYAHLSDAEFRAGRAAVMDDLLAKPTLFHTSYGRERWEAAARRNLAAER
ncbi:hypothetical protein [Nocardioides sp.]|uniref:HD domain-containing protein n=1 Tax=Nocardioides sp. TaxID=35761 RepID=UPI00356A45BD